MSTVEVIIPNLNGEKLLPVSLDSLRGQTFRDFAVTVVDNGSTDSSLPILAERYPEVKVLPLDRNHGFAAAVNRGIEATTGTFVSLLNNDIELDSRWLEELHGALVQHPEAGSCGARMMRYWERDRINVLGIRLNNDGEIDIIGAGKGMDETYNRLGYVFGVNAGAALYRRAMFQDIGLFDERFFASYEDVDLSYRAQLMGYKALYVPTAIAYHMVGATIKKKRYRPTYLNNRNKILFFWKNTPSEVIKKNFGSIAARKTLTFLKRVCFNFYKVRTAYYLAGTFAGLFNLPYALAQRKQILSHRRVSIDYLESIMDGDFV